jgi:gas vesicle protein
MKQYETEQSSGSNFLMGLVCGAAVGAAVGLLLAPKSGAELRQQISTSTDKLRRRAVDGYEQAADSVSGMVDDVVERSNKAMQRGKQTYENVRQSADAAVQGAVKAVDRM